MLLRSFRIGLDVGMIQLPLLSVRKQTKNRRWFLGRLRSHSAGQPRGKLLKIGYQWVVVISGKRRTEVDGFADLPKIVWQSRENGQLGPFFEGLDGVLVGAMIAVNNHPALVGINPPGG